jgi:hypothetical protein
MLRTEGLVEGFEVVRQSHHERVGLLHGNADNWLPPTVRPDPSTLLRTEGIVEGLWVSDRWFDKLITNS